MSRRDVNRFRLRPGEVVGGKYVVVGLLGRGWEGEVYRVRERGTGVERAAKFFFPKRNLRNSALRFYARKLHKLRNCPLLIQYHAQEETEWRGTRVRFLVSDLVEGEILSRFLRRQRGKRLGVFEGLHLLHRLAEGVEIIHSLKEYHGDLHLDNIIVKRRGIYFDVKLVDMFYWGAPSAERIRDDVCDLVRIFYDVTGGAARYASQPAAMKRICCGLKRGLITRKFRTAGHLRRYIETMSW
ncbi:MAG: protein kinase family protein [Candidatus Hydrogenedentota bacterium]|nr:MAG: protein kinase family protein [Candidatus Hydrogenedentota bacterium]